MFSRAAISYHITDSVVSIFDYAYELETCFHFATNVPEEENKPLQMVALGFVYIPVMPILSPSPWTAPGIKTYNVNGSQIIRKGIFHNPK
jgi:hypothetical protein